MSPDERDELVGALRTFLAAGRATFSRLKVPTRCLPGLLGFVGRQIAMERSFTEFLEAVGVKCEKAGPYVHAVFRAF